MLIDALVKRGELDQAQRVLQDSDISDDKPTGTLIVHLIPIARGRLRLRRNESAAALADFLAAGRFLTDGGYINPGFAEWRAGAVQAHLALGDPVTAAHLATENLDLARTFGAARSIALALHDGPGPA